MGSGDAFLAGYGMAQAMPRPFFSLAAWLADHEIDLPMTVTPLGAVARLEHAPEDFEGERERYRQRLDDSRRRLASYQSRGEGDFA
jgi:hypothetical protein